MPQTCIFKQRDGKTTCLIRTISPIEVVFLKVFRIFGSLDSPSGRVQKKVMIKVGGMCDILGPQGHFEASTLSDRMLQAFGRSL